MSFNLACIVREGAAATPDKAAVILDGVRVTYAELDLLSDLAARGLRRIGVGPGDAVGVMLPNIPQFLMAYFGILKAGAVMVPLNVLLKAPEVAFALRDSGAKALVVWDGVAAEAAKGATEAGGVPLHVVLTGFGELPPGALDAAALLAPVEGESGRFEMAATSPVDVAVLLYTSGTTGRPKGAELTHFQLYMNCDVAGRLFGLEPDDVVVGVLPMFHVFGLSSVLNVCLRYGGTVTLVPRFEPGKVLEVIQRDRATIFGGVPTMFIALLHHPDVAAFDLSSLRVAVSGGASIPGEVIRAFEERFGIPVLEGYGLSETASSASFNRVDARKVMSVGRPMWGVEMRTVDDDDNELPVGEEHVGEILIRGHNVMRGYHERPEATAEAMRGGWFHTGDMGYVDPDGFFFIVDRKKELIIRGGYNVYPREIEEVLYAHPAIAEAAVIGIPHDRLGEEVAAVVALKPGQSVTEAELIAWTKERVAAYKYPRTVRFEQTLPKGPTGKVLKRELKQA
ncbi:MAG TPA: long-chain fatty acid--CoA ligase [Candidatus Dormibacteraeota bacterium]|nr:long-chain fatty acid--CoA ligase [Candidatus Dormibacteraeota bacterium]